MFNPIRRNKNIGTKKQGHGQDNKLVIAYNAQTSLSLYEQLGKYEKIVKSINNHEFIFVIEETRENYQHHCPIEELLGIVSKIPYQDYGNLRLIILRQPKKKEQVLSPSRGIFFYSYLFEGKHEPAIILNAINIQKTFKRTHHLSIEDQGELRRLKEDGHIIHDNGKYFIIQPTTESVKNTQLYRTFPHEFGHYVDYYHTTKEGGENDIQEQQEYCDQKRSNKSLIEKEKFAHQYAAKIIGNINY